MAEIVIKSYCVSHYEDSGNYDRIGVLTTIIEEGTIQDFSNIFVLNYTQGYTRTSGEVLDPMIKEGITRKIHETDELMLDSYCIKIYFINGTAKDLIFFEYSLAKNALNSICSITFMQKFKFAFNDIGNFLKLDFNPYVNYS